jgi:hypothetical protein
MKVTELIKRLAALDAEAEVLIPGYEIHWDALNVVRVKPAQFVEPGDHWWNGAYQVCGDGEGAQHVLLVSTRRESHARRDGR